MVVVPPLLWVFWDNIIITHPLRKILRCFVSDGEASIREGRRALAKLRRMEELSDELGLPRKDVAFEHDTFEILAVAREYFFRPFDERMALRLRALVRRYRSRHRPAYNVVLNLSPVRLSRRRLRLLLALCFRYQRGYRLIDHIFTVRLLSLVLPLVRRLGRRYLPPFAEESAMGIHAVLR